MTGIARDWNTKDAQSGYVGYVLRFHVRKSYLDRHEIHEAGGKKCREYWIPAVELGEFGPGLAILRLGREQLHARLQGNQGADRDQVGPFEIRLDLAEF